MRRHRAVPAALLTALLATGLAACGSDEPEPEPDATSEPPAGAADTWPFTGLPADEDPARPHPAYMVKVDNDLNAAPQSGLDEADLVVQEMVEGGLTRLAAFFYSELPDEVGPVRSMRTTDVGIVAGSGATVVTSGAAQETIDTIDEASIDWVTEGSAGFSRDSGRSAPHNLMVDLTEVADAEKKADEARPDDYLPWGEADDLPEGKDATAFTARFSPAYTSNWEFTDDGYVLTDARSGDNPFPADTVVVLRVKVGSAGYEAYGAPVPESKLAGEGEAQIFHDGKVVDATWFKNAVEAPLELLDADGEAITVPAGRVWIELVPVDGKVTVEVTESR